MQECGRWKSTSRGLDQDGIPPFARCKRQGWKCARFETSRPYLTTGAGLRREEGFERKRSRRLIRRKNLARYIGPVCRLCRREGMKLFLKGERCFKPSCG